MTYFDNYFSFPSLNIDGDYEQLKKNDSAFSEPDKYTYSPDYIICETEVSLEDDIISLRQGWYPSEGGFITARDKNKFKCTAVTFADAGSYLIPYDMNKFKTLWSEAKSKFQKIEILEITKEELEEFLNNKKTNNE